MYSSRQLALPYTDLSINITEFVQKNDKQAHSWEMKEAINCEDQEFIRRGTFNVKPGRNIPDDANTLTARFVLEIKSIADGDVNCKARHVVGRNCGIIKLFIVHGAQTWEASSVRILSALASLFHLKIQWPDTNFAYLQSTEPLRRSVFITKSADDSIWIPVNSLNSSNLSMAYATPKTCGTNCLTCISRKTSV